MLLHVIAKKIDEHLNRMWDKEGNNDLYYYPAAFASGRYIRVSFITYQGSKALTKAEAEEYLAWLDAGNEGTYYKMELENSRKISKTA